MNIKSFLKMFLLGFVFVSCHRAPIGEGPDSYIDGCHRLHLYTINPDAKKNDYNIKNYRKTWNDRLYYEDDKYISRLGLDVSRLEGDVDWHKVKKAGFDFVILRAAYRRYQAGTLHLDEMFHENIQKALAEGFDVGAYVYSQALNPEEAKEEAFMIIEALKDYNITLPVVYDPETVPYDWARTDNITSETVMENTHIFCDLISKAGYTPMIYTNMIWQEKYFNMGDIPYKVWYADYEKYPQSPYEYDFVQFSAWGRVPGINIMCDLDIQLLPKVGLQK